MKLRGLAAALTCASMVLPHAVRASEAATELHLQGAYSTLDNATADWREAALAVRHRFAPARALGAQLRRTHRFGQQDLEASGSLLLPLAGSWSVLGEVGGSAQHRVLPAGSVFLGVSGPLGGGFAAGAGLRASRYTVDDVWVANAFGEYYGRRYRVAYTLFHGHIESDGDGLTHLLQADLYYDTGQIGLAFAVGEEPARISPQLVTVAEVSNALLLGRHWFGTHWGMAYQAGQYRQGDFYTRRELQLGFLYRF